MGRSRISIAASCEGRIWRRASAADQAVMRLSDEGGRCADKIGRRVARIAIADLDRVGRVFLHQPEDQRLRACLRTAPGRRMSDSVVVVEVGTRGRAGRVHTATRCFT